MEQKIKQTDIFIGKNIRKHRRILLIPVPNFYLTDITVSDSERQISQN